MDLGTKNPSIARHRAITAIGRRDAAFKAADDELSAALADMPHRHSGTEPTGEQSGRLRRAAGKRNKEWIRLAAIFDGELWDSRDPEVMGQLVDKILKKMGKL